MDVIIELIEVLLAVLATSAPSIALVYWLVVSSRKKKLAGVSLRDRTRASLIASALTFGACVIAAVGLRASQRTSNSGFQIEPGSVTACAYYVLATLSWVATIVFAARLLFTMAREPKE